MAVAPTQAMGACERGGVQRLDISDLNVGATATVGNCRKCQKIGIWLRSENGITTVLDARDLDCTVEGRPTFGAQILGIRSISEKEIIQSFCFKRGIKFLWEKRHVWRSGSWVCALLQCRAGFYFGGPSLLFVLNAVNITKN